MLLKLLISLHRLFYVVILKFTHSTHPVVDELDDGTAASGFATGADVTLNVP